MNKEQVRSLLARNDRAVERGIVALYHRQTVDEQHTSTTKESNGVGFNARDAEYATYLAKWVLSGRHLTGRHLEAARRITTYYARQLSEVSEQAPPPFTNHHIRSAGGLASVIRDLDPFQSEGQANVWCAAREHHNQA